jgi:hypothetical protein
MQIEFPTRLHAVLRPASHIRVEGRQNTDNWFHFAIPTPVIVNDNRLQVGSVLLRFRTNTTNAFVQAVHIYDGETRIAAHDNLRLSSTSWSMQRFDVPTHPEIRYGLGISVAVRFLASLPTDNGMEFSAAGCDFMP